jgi:hypothetical protein
MRLEELDKLKNLLSSSDFEPATSRLVAWFLNQLRYGAGGGDKREEVTKGEE